MRPVFLHDKLAIESFLRREPYLHLYALGDLDEFFWPYTTWIAAQAGSQIEALMLLYSGGGLPVVLAVGGGDRQTLRELLCTAARQPILPRRFNAHFSPGLSDGVEALGYRLEPHGLFFKMGLLEPARLYDYAEKKAASFDIRRLGVNDETALVRMYDESYPGNWFDPRMLATGCYFGAWQSGQIVGAAGVHVYSPRYGAAALGNICSRPEVRGQGIGTAVTAQVCLDMIERIDTIGLNVKADNAPALAAYRRLGFQVVAEYEEYLIEAV